MPTPSPRRLAAAAAAALALAAGAAAAEPVTYTIGDEAFEGYFAAAESPRGLVVLIHDWDGADGYEARRADMLAELGYDAFAIDVFGAGVRPGTTEDRLAAIRAAFADPERLVGLVAGGVEAARGRSAAEGLVVMGYCFGGTVTLAAARSGAIDAAGWASFHGNFPEGPDWPAETAPILIMHGAVDENPDMAAVAAFMAEAEAAGLDYDVETYSGANHAFTVFDGPRYQQRADERSWASFQRFLAETLDGPAS